MVELVQVLIRLFDAVLAEIQAGGEPEGGGILGRVL